MKGGTEEDVCRVSDLNESVAKPHGFFDYGGFLCFFCWHIQHCNVYSYVYNINIFLCFISFNPCTIGIQFIRGKRGSQKRLPIPIGLYSFRNINPVLFHDILLLFMRLLCTRTVILKIRRNNYLCI